MSPEQRNHLAAVSWINAELDELARIVGQKNASSAATSAITLAFLLLAISEDEHRAFRTRIDHIYASYNASLVNVA